VGTGPAGALGIVAAALGVAGVPGFAPVGGPQAGAGGVPGFDKRTPFVIAAAPGSGGLPAGPFGPGTGPGGATPGSSGPLSLGTALFAGAGGIGLPRLPGGEAPVFADRQVTPGAAGAGELPGAGMPKTAMGGLYVGVAGSFDMPMGVTSSDYEADAEGMRNLLAEVRKRTNVHVTVQERYVPLQLANIKNTPIIHLRGHRPFRFTNDERRALKDYVAQGGTIFAEDSHGPFGECFRREMKKIFGKAPEDLPADHELYRAYYVFDDIPSGDMGERYPIQGIRQGGRLGVIYSRNDYGDCWEGTGGWVKPETREPAFKIGTNIYIYVVANSPKYRRPAPAGNQP